MIFLKRILFLSILFACLTTHASAKVLNGIKTFTQSGVTIKVKSRFSQIQIGGLCPIIVEIDNDTKKQHTWDISFKSSYNWNYEPSFSKIDTMTVGPGKKKTFEFSVPIINGDRGSYSKMLLEIEVRGYGIEHQSIREHFNYNSDIRPTLISDQLRNIKNKLQANTSGSGHGNTPLCSFNQRDLGSNWMDYTGFASVWITSLEWKSLSADVTNGLKKWVALGGNLFITFDGKNKIKAHGLGMIEWVNISNVNKSIQPITNKIKFVKANPLALSKINNWTSDLLTAIKPIESKPFLFSLLTAIIGIVIGPINLFLYCRKKRMKIVFTTPLIAVLTSLVLLVFIVFQDGIGGSGFRSTLVVTLPEDHLTIKMQDQVSTSGLVIGSSFDVPEKTIVTPLQLNHLKNNFHTNNYTNWKNSFSGDWFNSRSQQGQKLQSVTPSRSKIDIQIETKQDKKTIHALSSIDDTLNDFYYIDHQDQIWYTKKIRTGEKIILEKVESAEYKKWMKSVSKKFDQPTKALLSNIDFRKGYYFSTSTTDKAAIPNYSSFNWKQVLTLYTGPTLLSEVSK